MTGKPEREIRTGETASPGQFDEPAAISELRRTIRDTIVQGIGLVLERDRFLRRVVDVVADGAGLPMVALYVRDGDEESLTLGAKTRDAPDWMPVRILSDIVPDQPSAFMTAPEILGVENGFDLQALVLPLRPAEVAGVMVIPGVFAEDLSAEDRRALEVVAEEIAPTVAVSNRHFEVQQNSVIDLATGAFTYTFFQRRLVEEVSRAQRTGHDVSIVLVEVLDFTEFERIVGYAKADAVLREMASGFAAVTRISDVVARRRRTGFAILLPESDIEGSDVAIGRIEQRLERIQQALREGGYHDIVPRLVTGSSSYPADSSDAAGLILAADQRMVARVEEDQELVV